MFTLRSWRVLSTSEWDTPDTCGWIHHNVYSPPQCEETVDLSSAQTQEYSMYTHTTAYSAQHFLDLVAHKCFPNNVTSENQSQYWRLDQFIVKVLGLKEYRWFILSKDSKHSTFSKCFKEKKCVSPSEAEITYNFFN